MREAAGREPLTHDVTVREIVLDAHGIPMSAILATPRLALPRAVIVAIHGGGIRAGYFRGGVRPEQSLLDLGAAFGWTVLALDRPGYGASAVALPDGQSLDQQARTVRIALDDFAARYPTGKGLFVLAHSYGGALALSLAAQERGRELLGLDISGCGYEYAVDIDQLPDAGTRGNWWLNWGLLRCYPPETFRRTASLMWPMPAAEAAEAPSWPARFPGIARRVRVPVRLTFAEYERWWRHDPVALDTLSALLADAPAVVIDRQRHVGHNISLGVGARSYHLRALAFAEECLTGLRS
jgi:pimeloyl-ACP methyl ester carboxylesterase